jgi:LysM repeat protein
MKYQTGRTYTVQSGDTLSGIAQAQGAADYNEIYNLNKALIGSDPNMIKPGQVLTMPGAAPAAPVSTGTSPLSGYAGVSPLAGYPGFGGTGYAAATPYTRPSASSTASATPPATLAPAKDSKSIRKELPYGIAAAGALGQLATVASIDAKKGVAPINVPYIKPPEKEYFTRVRDTGKAGREAERRATIREINKATGPQKFALADQARATLLREEEKAKSNIDAMNTKIEQAEIALNTSRKDSTNFKNSEIALRNAMSTRDEALRVLESVNNKKKAYGDIFRGATKDILQYYSAEELARATEGERGVMGRFYDNPYDKFSKQYKKQNPGASPQETYAAFQTSLTV